MTRLFHTGFELARIDGPFESKGLFDLTHTHCFAISTGGKRSGRSSLRCATASSTTPMWGLWDNRRWPSKTELYFRIAPYMAGTLRNNAVFSIEDDGGTVLAQITHDKKIYRRVGGALTEVTGLSYTGAFEAVEFHIKIHATQGIWELRIDGVTVDSNVNVDTTGAGTFFGNVRFGAYTDVKDVWYADDFAVNDTLGVTNNAWCGLGGIEGLRPTANGSIIQFSPLAPDTNYENVNDLTLDVATYNQALALGNVDVFETGGLPAGEYAIVAVGVTAYGILASAGGDSVTGVARDGGVTVESPSLATVFNHTEEKTTYAQIPLAPDGGAWSVAKVNSAEFGYKAVTP